MTTKGFHSRRVWLCAGAVLLLAALAVIAWQGYGPASQAAPPAVPLAGGARVAGEAVPGLITAGDQVSHTLFLPMMLMEPTILMQEDFEAGIDRWAAFLNHHRLEPGQWYYGPGDGYLQSGGLTHDCCTGSKVASDALMMYLQPGAEEWTDYRVEAKIYLTGGVTKEGDPEPNSGDPIGFWIRGHYQEGEYESQWVSGYYVVVVGKSDDEVHFVRIAKMQQPGDCEACEKPYRMYNFDNPMFKVRSPDLPGPFEHYRWYTLAVEVRGANIQIFLDGQPVLDWTDPLLPYLSGTVGFKVHETKTASFDDVLVTPLH